MQNKTLSFFSALLLSATFITVPVFAQSVESVPPTTQSPSLPKKSLDIAAKTQAAQKLLQESVEQSTPVADRTAVNFPARQNLSSIELAPLPGLQDSLITGPAPIEKSISKKDLPSEQLLGRITPEIFQEMAELERGNAFLKLQMQKESLRNDLEKLKTQYRESRLAEIAKREDVVKERIKWWQEQEEQRLALEHKKQETAKLEQEIADAAADRELLRQEAKEKREKEQRAAEEAAKRAAEQKDKDAAPVIVPEEEFKPLSSSYTLVGVKGVRGELSARLKSTEGNEYTVKVGEKLPTGHAIVSITKDNVSATLNGREDVLVFAPTSNS